MSDSTPRDGDENRREHGRRDSRSGAGSHGRGNPPRGDRPGERSPRDGQSQAGNAPERPRGTSSHNGRAGATGGKNPWQKRDGEQSPAREPWPKRDGEQAASGKPWQKRDGASSGRGGGGSTGRRGGAGDGGAFRGGARGPRDGDKKLWTREGRPARGDRDAARREEELTEEQKLARELRSVRPRHDDPEIPDDVAANQLDKVARAELKTLSKDNADTVARHLVMAGRLIDEDAELAHRHALSAARRAGRVGVVRETLAITAYATGDFALALRELRTYRRISGSENQLALMVDSERGVGRPDRALELGRSVDRSTLPAEVQAALAIAMSGARLDLGQTDAALAELEVPQLDAGRAYSYSPALFRAYADVLEELGRAADSERWSALADRAEQALSEAAGGDDDETVDVIEEELVDGEVPWDGEVAGVGEVAGTDVVARAGEAVGADETVEVAGKEAGNDEFVGNGDSSESGTEDADVRQEE